MEDALALGGPRDARRNGAAQADGHAAAHPPADAERGEVTLEAGGSSSASRCGHWPPTTGRAASRGDRLEREVAPRQADRSARCEQLVDHVGGSPGRRTRAAPLEVAARVGHVRDRTRWRSPRRARRPRGRLRASPPTGTPCPSPTACAYAAWRPRACRPMTRAPRSRASRRAVRAVAAPGVGYSASASGPTPARSRHALRASCRAASCPADRRAAPTARGGRARPRSPGSSDPACLSGRRPPWARTPPRDDHSNAPGLDPGHPRSGRMYPNEERRTCA